jgi:protein phosphatase
VRSGDLTRAQAAEHPQKNLITRALGAEDEVEADNMVLPVEAGDRLLLCSDGLSDMIPEDRIGAILKERPDEPEAPARKLVSAALDAGGTDNVTVVVVDVREREEPEENASGGTREMQAVAPPDPEGRASRPRSGSARDRRGAPGGRARRKRSRGFLAALGKMIRGLAIILVVAAALTPAYLWGSSRYYLGFEDGEVVLYQGIPYSVGSLNLNREAERTGVKESEVDDPYRPPIKNHKLYTRDEVDRVLQDLGN